MTINVVMPQLGETVVEGKVAKWLKKEGDAVDRLEPILEVETDKVTTEVTAEEAGTLLKILVPEGTTVHAGTPLAVIGAAGEVVAAGPAAVHAHAGPPGSTNGGTKAGQAETSRPRESAGGKGKGSFVSPVVARIAAEHGIDPAEVPGTGQGGRVTKQDILAFIAEREKGGAPAQPAQAPAEREISQAFNEPTPAAAAQAAQEEPAPWETPGSGDLFRPTDDIYNAATASTPPSPARGLAGEGVGGAPPGC